MNNQGEKIEYLYEAKEGTLQRYLGSAPIEYTEYKELLNETKNKEIIIYSLITILGACIIGFSIVIVKIRKGKVDEEIH